jgi:hypothetical protein
MCESPHDSYPLAELDTPGMLLLLQSGSLNQENDLLLFGPGRVQIKGKYIVAGGMGEMA